MLQNLSIGKRMALVMGAIVVIQLAVTAIAWWGTDRVEHVLHGSTLRSLLERRMTDHMRWADEVSRLLNDEAVNHIELETDAHACGLGTWLYGPGRAEAEARVPAIAPILDRLEAPHAELHASAEELLARYRPADPQLPGTILARERDHLRWAKALQAVFLDRRDSIDVELDPTECALGTWLDSPDFAALHESADAATRKAIAALRQTHEILHDSAADIEQKLAHGAEDRARAAAAEARAACAGLGRRLSTELHRAMDESVDPQLAEANAAADPVAMTTWHRIDTVMNESVIQPFLEARLVLESARSVEQLDDFDAALTSFSAGVAAWRDLLVDTALEDTGARIAALRDDFAARAADYRSALAARATALASLRAARAIFTDQTVPALERTVELLGQLHAAARVDLAGLAAAREIYATRTVPALAQVQQHLGEVSATIVERIGDDRTMRGTAEQTRWGVVAACGVAIVAAIGLALVLTRSIVRPVQRTMALADAVRDGDLDHRLELSGENEFARMGAALNSMADSLQAKAAVATQIADGRLDVRVETTSDRDQLGLALQTMVASLREIVGSIRDDGLRIAASSEDLSSASTELDASASEVSSQADSAASATEEMSVNIASLASGAEQLSVNMATVAENIGNLAESIDGVGKHASTGADTSQRARQMVEATAASMRELGQAASQIGEVTEVIKHIAQQTNLLALNATIEAASAGEAGRGFAVVANEIKELAAQSAGAAEQIATQIAGVQESTGEAVEATDAMVTIIAELDTANRSIGEAVQSQSGRTGEIASATEQANAGAGTIAANISEMSQGANDLAGTIQGVSQAITDSARGVTQVNQAATELAGLAANMREVIGRFTLTDAAPAAAPRVAEQPPGEGSGTHAA